MGTLLRPARPEDFPAIRRLTRQVGNNPFGLHWSRFWVVVDGEDRMIACGQVKRHRDGSRELASIAVEQTDRGKGLARQVIERLQDENHSTLYLTCRRSMGPLYEKFGFQSIGRRDMPTYFRFASRFVNGLHKTGIVPEPMLVMRFDPQERN